MATSARTDEPLAARLQLHIVAKFLVQKVAPEYVGSHHGRQSCEQLKPRSTPWHRFLDELCLLCDFDGGGETVRAIGPEAAKGRTIFWVATEHGDTGKIVKHLEDVLGKLKHMLHTPDNSPRSLQQETANDIHEASIKMSPQRVKGYRQLLCTSIEESIEKLSPDGNIPDPNLRQTLSDLQAKATAREKDADLQLCVAAYNFRHGEVHQQLQDLIATTTDTVWRHLSHRIGRLGAFMKGSRFLAQTAFLFERILRDCIVQLVPKPFQVKAALETDIAPEHLLSAVCPWLAEQPDMHRSAVAKLQSAQKRRENATHRTQRQGASEAQRKKPRFRPVLPVVHAEIIVLDHFYSHNLRFVDDDRYIGCSKPSCFCCAEFIQAHPGRFAPRPCHGNVYVKWSPPRALDGTLLPSTAAVLQTMTESIERDLRVHIPMNIWGAKQSRDSFTDGRLSVGDRWDGVTVVGP